jgi:hypothetical protein
MANVVATVSQVHQVAGSAAGPEQSGAATVRKCYLVIMNTAVYTASADTATVTGICDRIKEFTKKGVAMTYRAAAAGPPGRTSANVAAYVSVHLPITNASETLSFHIGGTTTEANTAAATGVGMFVVVDEGVAT